MKLFELGIGQEGLEEAAKHIVTDCQPYLRAVDVDKIVLYRGMNPEGAYKYVTSRQNRNPRDSHPLAHRVADDWFRRNFGTPLRSASVFVARSVEGVDRYGEPHYIFPTGRDWEFYGSRDVKDFTASLNRFTDDRAPELYYNKLRKPKWVGDNPPKLEKQERKIYKQIVIDFLEQANYQLLSATELRQIDHTSEIMMVTPSYYAVHQGADNSHNVFDYIREDLNST